MRAGIAIDKWKLEIFERHLKNAGFNYEQSPGLTPGTLILIVETDREVTLAGTVKQAQQEAAKQKKRRGMH